MSEYKIGQRVRLHEGVISKRSDRSFEDLVGITFPDGREGWVNESAIAEVLPDPIKAGDEVSWNYTKHIVLGIDIDNAWVKEIDGGGYSTAPIVKLIKFPSSE
jgi:hypothetical protein